MISAGHDAGIWMVLLGLELVPLAGAVNPVDDFTPHALTFEFLHTHLNWPKPKQP